MRSSSAAAILGYQVKQVGGGRESISVKGLAEKPIKADRAEWTLSLQVKGATIAEALGKLRKERPALDQFLATAGFDKASLTESNESSEPNYEEVEGHNGNMRRVQDGHVARQSITINTADIGKIIAAAKGIVQFEADGHPVSFGEPQFLVSNLEEVKMSLIGAAMQTLAQRRCARRRRAQFRPRIAEHSESRGVDALGFVRARSDHHLCAYGQCQRGSSATGVLWLQLSTSRRVDKIANRVVVTGCATMVHGGNAP